MLEGGLYEVTRTTLNEESCDEDGEVVGDVKRFFTLGEAIRSGYRTTTCDGEDEPSCPARDTYLGDAVDGGWQDLHLEAHPEEDDAGDTECWLIADLTRVEPGEGDEMRHLQIRWEARSPEDPERCNLELAMEHFDAGELECVSRTVRSGPRVQ